MTNQKPLVSVLLISMNHENYIEQAINSILSQSYSNFEIIFLDNNSKDKTFEIGDLLLKKSNVNYVGIKNDSNKGVSENLNIVVDNAKGTYVSILSGDDWYELKNIELRLDFLTKNNLDVVLADGYKYIQNSGKKKNVYPNKKKE